MKFTAAALVVFSAASVEADIYMHNPRGSNNRNCRTDNNKERRNDNRLFDSENNDNGGYSCPRAWPFDCYKFVNDDAAFADCVAQESELDSKGDLTNPNAVNTPMMYYYSGSELSFEWTVQHGMGTNDEVHSQVVLQYACEDTLQDNCGAQAAAAAGTCKSPFYPDASVASVCGPRDGTPKNVNDEATATIPETVEAQPDMNFGRHETYSYYKECRNRERNKGLFIADQNVNGNDARSTRQNPNPQRYGLECPEESQYWPYWHWSPWKDIAVIAESEDKCEFFRTESQNVKSRGRCDCGGECPGDGKQPNNKVSCEKGGFTWCEDAAHGIAPPECLVGAYTRQNHLGNEAGGTSNNRYNWTLPEVDRPMRCVLRMRYNISTADFGDVSVVGTTAQSEGASPLKDNDENEAETYLAIAGLGLEGDAAKVGFAINTDQFGRTFQDRSYMFEIRPAPTEGPCKGRKIHNLNVRGKRGNIVQAYPAVEYDFVPDHLVAATDECVHVQWTGSDYNPNRNGNNGEAGPYSSNNQNKETKSDRHNIALLSKPGDNMPNTDASAYSLFDVDAAVWKRLLLLDQPINNPDACWSFEKLKETFNNRAEREETHHNCMKLSGAATPYFDAGPLPMGQQGHYHFMSTRNNNFSNRGQKGEIIVVNGGLSPWLIGAIVVGALGLVVGGVVFRRRRNARNSLPPVGATALKNNGGSSPGAVAKAAGAAGMFAGGITSLWRSSTGKAAGSAAGVADDGDFVVAVHYHSASEPGELTFRKGDKIRVLSRDASGWFEGEINGQRGLFPGNYTKPAAN